MVEGISEKLMAPSYVVLKRLVVSKVLAYSVLSVFNTQDLGYSLIPLTEVTLLRLWYCSRRGDRAA